jgi:hypothetical protein
MVCEKPAWVRVTRERRCPVCSRSHWCGFSPDGAAVCCMRVQSEKQLPNGGWLHKLETAVHHELPKAAPKPRLSSAEVAGLVRRFYECEQAEAQRWEIAEKLGVKALVLRDLRVGCGWDEYRNCWFTSWPERDAQGSFVGLVRRYESGEKRTYPGSRHGLIYRRPWLRGGRVLFLPEGGSDVAAILTLGLPALGRPSNLGGLRELSRLLLEYRGEVRVLGERDQRPSPECGDCGNCGLCWPGRFGAIQTALRLREHGIHARPVLLPGAKDAREWLNQHPTAKARDFLEATA